MLHAILRLADRTGAGPGKEPSVDARELHANSLVIDGLNAGGPHKEWLPLVKEAGVDATVSTIGWMQGTRMTLQDIEFLKKRIAESPEALTFATTAAHIEQAKRDGKTAVVMCSQNTRLIEDEVSLLDTFHALGMRIIQLTYNEANLVGDGCIEPRNGGLTEFGRAVVKRMNVLGVIIDGSHTGKRTTMEAMALTEQPFVFTHANAKAVSESARNIDDEQIEACARTGGVIGINAFSAFVKAEDPQAASMDDFFAHVAHVIKVAGIDHIGLGLDQTETRPWYTDRGVGIDPNQSADRRERVAPKKTYPAYSYVPGLESITGMPLLTQEFVRRRYKEEAIRKILGLNWLRVYRQVWGS
jgi:membrane dipeptidase